MKATEPLRQRIVLAEDSFAELVLWRLPEPLAGSSHHFKYRLAYVVSQVCVLRYDNEDGKGGHWHWGAQEQHYEFSGPEKLLRDFQQDIARWNRENRDTRRPAAG
jgi:hypothetical protein